MNLICENAPRIQWYSELYPFVAAICSRVNDYTLRFDCVEGVAPPHGQECNNHWVLNGEQFASFVIEHPQFIWAVVSAIPKHYSESHVNTQCEPYADGNPAFWTGKPSPQHPFADFEIVCWDASATLLIGANELIATVFQTAYPESLDLDRQNDYRDRTMRCTEDA